jgi:hypothetical protein
MVTIEVTLRSYCVNGAGETRDIVMYSIIESEWADVKGRLQEMMTRVRDARSE